MNRRGSVGAPEFSCGGGLDVDNSSLVGAWRIGFDGRDGCGVCDVQCGGVVEEAPAGGYVEQRVVSVVGVRGDQLHEELGVCWICCRWVVDRRLSLDDVFAAFERCVSVARDTVAAFVFHLGSRVAYWNELTDSAAPLPVVSGSDQPPGGTMRSFTSLGPQVPWS